MNKLHLKLFLLGLLETRTQNARSSIFAKFALNLLSNKYMIEIVFSVVNVSLCPLTLLSSVSCFIWRKEKIMIFLLLRYSFLIYFIAGSQTVQFILWDFSKLRHGPVGVFRGGCDYGASTQKMAHLLPCTLCDATCTLRDLSRATTNAVEIVEF